MTVLVISIERTVSKLRGCYRITFFPSVFTLKTTNEVKKNAFHVFPANPWPIRLSGVTPQSMTALRCPDKDALTKTHQGHSATSREDTWGKRDYTLVDKAQDGGRRCVLRVDTKVPRDFLLFSVGWEINT